ncbi:reverse transcriptase-like protein [Streptomyces thermocarboxydus]
MESDAGVRRRGGRRVTGQSRTRRVRGRGERRGDGETLAEAAEYIGVTTNNVAEYRGLLAGLRAARELDPDARVHVRMDSKLVIEQMSGRWKIKHPAMKPLAAEAATVFPPDRVTYEWIPRERNAHADRLANEAMDAGARGGLVACGQPRRPGHPRLPRSYRCLRVRPGTRRPGRRGCGRRRRPPGAPWRRTKPRPGVPHAGRRHRSR